MSNKFIKFKPADNDELYDLDDTDLSDSDTDFADLDPQVFAETLAMMLNVVASPRKPPIFFDGKFHH